MNALHKYLRLVGMRLIIAGIYLGFFSGFWLMALGGWIITYIFFGFGFEDHFKLMLKVEEKADVLLGRLQ